MAERDWYHATEAGTWEYLTPRSNTGWPDFPPRIPPPPKPETFNFYDEMSRHPDGTTSATALTGQTWDLFQDGEVRGGRFDSIDTGAVYLETLVNGGRIIREGAEWSFDDQGGTLTESGTLCLCTWADGGIVANGFGRRTSAHAIITQNAVQWYVRDAQPGTNTTVTLLSTQPLAEPLAPGVLHRADMEVDFVNRTGTLRLGDGRSWLWVDDRIQGHPGEVYACWEPFYSGNANASRIKLARIWANAE